MALSPQAGKGLVKSPERWEVMQRRTMGCSQLALSGRCLTGHLSLPRLIKTANDWQGRELWARPEKNELGSPRVKNKNKTETPVSCGFETLCLAGKLCSDGYGSGNRSLPWGSRAAPGAHHAPALLFLANLPSRHFE